MANLVKMELKKRDIALKNVPRFYKALMENKISVGVHKIEGRSVGTTDIPKKANILERAYFNEFGTSHRVIRTFRRKSKTDGKWVTFKEGTVITVRPRPFIRIYLYPEKLMQIRTAYLKLLNGSMDLGLNAPVSDAKTMLKHVAKIAQEEMQDIIEGRTLLRPNNALTIYLKGFDYPLLETGGLLNAIRGKVEKR